ncbi:MAG: glycosyltransferase family 4 protein [Anaerolineales bacterium]|nr:glycosyltransferase family 4 protein [Anaerolineales bacterium]
MTKVILVANTSWFLYNFRLSWAEELARRGMEVVLSAPRDSFTPKLEELGFRFEEIHMGRQTLAPWKEVPTLRQLRRLYLRERPALVHHLTIKPVIYGSIAARLSSVPAVVNGITGRGYAFLSREPRARLVNRLATTLYRLAFRHPNQAVIFENETDRNDFMRRGLVRPEQTHLIEGAGIDPARFFPPEVEPEPDAPLIILPARMLWDKGPGVLMEAARLLQPRVKARVALVGSPDPGNPSSIPQETLEAWQSEGVLEWWGWQADMPAVYRQCQIVTLPTMYGEGVPSALMEAAASGRPIVASDFPGPRSVVQPGRNGLLVPPGDSQALADALEKLAIDPELRAEMGTAGRQIALERFTTDRLNAARMKVYEQLLSK